MNDDDHSQQSAETPNDKPNDSTGDYDPKRDPDAIQSPLESALQRSIGPKRINAQRAHRKRITNASTETSPSGVTEGKAENRAEDADSTFETLRPPARGLLSVSPDSTPADDPEEGELPEERWHRTLKPWQARFLCAFSTLGMVGLSCREARVSRQTIANHRSSDPLFAAALAEVEADVVETVEAALRISATVGDPEPIFQSGRRVGTRRRKSDRAADIILRAERPDKYRPDYQGAPPQQTIILQSADQIAEVVRGLSPCLAPKLIEGRIVEPSAGDMEQRPQNGA